MTLGLRLLTLALLPWLAACKEDAPAAARTPAAPPRHAEAQAAAEARLRQRLSIDGPLALRAVLAHRQLLADTVAVCGQVNPTGRPDTPWLPYVAVVAFEGAQVARLDLVLALTSPEATRVYFEMVDRCFDGGGPPVPRGGARPLPPAPEGLQGAEGVAASLRAPPPTALPSTNAPLIQPAPAPQPGTPLAAGQPMPRGAVMTSQRTPANIRAEPNGGSAILRVAPRGSVLQVFSEAPGGWLMVGETEPWGWVHASLLDGR
ncbi:SH3 domain-containing protein [Falsiroseomonas sp. HW251]|uniref:SH3 domain-containing protein n=1 Tax=Falsiroseomonas sp. HW251 TaxID=3390998 RepID=UPI003D3239E6